MTLIDQINDNLILDDVLEMIPGLKLNGTSYEGDCPTGHDSKSGKSFRVNTMAPNFHCFNCGISGSYIHLVELINFGVSSSGKGGTDTFIQTLELLKDKYGLDTPNSYGEKDNIYEIISWACHFYNQKLFQDKPVLVRKIGEKYGLTSDFMMQECIGYGLKCPSKEMLEFFSYEELLSTGLFNKSERSSTGLFHIHQDRIVFPYNVKGRPIYTIGRKTAQTKDWSTDIKAPKYFKQYVHNEKHNYVSNVIKNPIVHCNKDYNEIVVTEGITDYLVAKQNGINAVSAVTTSFKKGEYELVAEFCKKFKKVYIANDNDENGAGQKGCERICEMFSASRINPYIITIPRHGDKDKTDLSEFVRDNGIDAFLNLRADSQTYLDTLINKIPEDIDKSELLEALTKTLDCLKHFSEEVIEIYILDKIKKRFGLASMKSLIKAIKDKAYDKQLAVNESVKKQSNNIFEDHSSDINMISSGQDYYKDCLYYTVTRPQQATDKNGVVKIINKPFLVGSNKNIIEIKDQQIISDGFALNKKISPDNKFENWTFSNSDYSVEKYVNGNVDINPYDLFLKIKQFINKYVYFVNDYESTFCAIALMTFPLYMVFDAIGYIHLWAEKRSGKTTLLEIFQMLGFNSMMSSSMTDAAIFRSIEFFRPLLLIDEAENLNPSAKAKENNPSEKLELLKSGYKKSGSATRCEGQNNTVMTFHNFSPKVFAGTKRADSILEDRMILIEMKRASEGAKIEELIEAKVKKEASEIRDMTHCYAMQFCNKIEDIYHKDLDNYKEELSDHKVIFRSKELWTPYLCTALLVDAYSNDNGVFNQLLEKALNGVETTAAFSGDSKSIEIIEHLYLWVKRVQNGYEKDMALLYEGDVYLRRAITDFFIKGVLKSTEHEDDFSYVNYQNLKHTLRKFNVIDKDCDMQNYRITNKRGAALILRKERILDSLITYKNSYDDEVLEDINVYKGKSIETLDID